MGMVLARATMAGSSVCYMFGSRNMKPKASQFLSTVNRKGVEPASRKSCAPENIPPKSPNMIQSH